jgi:hypothetical protein
MKRTAILLNAETATTAATKVIDLDISDPISRIVVSYKPTNNGATPTAHPDKCITKLEIVDGADVLVSVSGIEAKAAAILGGNNPSWPTLTFINDNVNSVILSLNFGRWLWDKVLALDPRKFTNPQLRITHDKSLGGSSPDAAVLSVFADIFDSENVSPTGFLSLREAFGYSLTSSAEQRVDLPVDKVIRRILLQSLAVDKQPYEQYNKIKLSIDSDKKVLIDNASVSDLLKFAAGNPTMTEHVHGNIGNATVQHFITPTYAIKGSLTGFGTAITGEQLNNIYGGNIDITTTSTGDVMALIHGGAPHGALSIPFGDQNDPADWLNLSGAKKLEAIITAGSSVGSSSTCQVVTESLRKY